MHAFEDDSADILEQYSDVMCDTKVPRVRKGVKYCSVEEVENRVEWIGVDEKVSSGVVHFIGPNAACKVGHSKVLLCI